MLPINTILHPTDFSQRSADAFRLACSLAKDHGARLVVLHVREIPAAVYGEFGDLPVEAENDDAIREQLSRVVPAHATVRVEHFVRSGDPALEIVRFAEEISCGLIVIGTHGRTGLGRLLMGSVAEQVMRKAPCPVLTIKTPFPRACELETVRADARPVARERSPAIESRPSVDEAVELGVGD